MGDLVMSFFGPAFRDGQEDLLVPSPIQLPAVSRVAKQADSGNSGPSKTEITKSAIFFRLGGVLLLPAGSKDEEIFVIPLGNVHNP